MVNSEGIKSGTREFIERCRNKITELSDRIQSTDFYSSLPEFIKQAGGWIALTPLSIFLILKIMSETFKKRKYELIEYYVHDPEKEFDPTFSKRRAKEVFKKLSIFEYEEMDPETLKILTLFYKMQYKFHKENQSYNKMKSRMPTDFALLFYSLLNPDLIPVTYDSDLFVTFKDWLADKDNDVLTDYLREKIDFNLLSPITPPYIKSGGKYLLDSNIIIGYRNWPVDPEDYDNPKKEEARRAQNSIEITRMFRRAIGNGSIEIHIVPLVIEEIAFNNPLLEVDGSLWKKAKDALKKSLDEEIDRKTPKNKWGDQSKFRRSQRKSH